MQMKNLALIGIAKRHKEAAAAELSIVHQNYPLKHVIVEGFRHTVECPNVLIQRTNNVEITP